MKKMLLGVLLLALAAPVHAASLDASPAERAAAAWFDAFNSGSEDAMLRVADQHFGSGVPREQRLRNWKRLRGETGTLTPVRAVQQGDALVVTARDGQGELVSVTFESGEEPPKFGGIQLEREEEEVAPDPDTSPLTEARALANVTRLADSLAALDRFAGVVRIERGGRVALERAWGEADRERRVPNRVDTKFNLGSINKNFTKTLIAKLAEQGKLSPEDLVSKHLPDFPRDKGDRITVQQLLDMKSGLGDFFGPRYPSADRGALRDQRDWFPLFQDDPLRFEPGTRQQYSNAGYVVLGAVAEAATGRNYYDLMRELVYRPAGMTNTDSYFRDADVPNRATGYGRGGPGRDGALESVRAGQPARGSAAGGGYSTAEDLSRYVRALRGSKILKPATAERFFGARVNQDGTVSVGLGIAGGSPGVNAALTTFGDWVVIVLANRDEPVAERIEAKARGWLKRVAN